MPVQALHEMVGRLRDPRGLAQMGGMPGLPIQAMPMQGMPMQGMQVAGGMPMAQGMSMYAMPPNGELVTAQPVLNQVGFTAR